MTCYEVLKIVSEKDKDCLENVKNVLNDALNGSKYFKVKEIKFLSDSIKIEFENELSYEGDIVLIRIDKTNILHKTVVKFKHGAFIVDIIGDNDYIYLFHFGFNKDDFEVVGNIYENHKLLEEK